MSHADVALRLFFFSFFFLCLFLCMYMALVDLATVPISQKA